MNLRLTLATAALVVVGSVAAQAQDTSQARIPIKKDVKTSVASGVVATPAMDTLTWEWYVPTGTTCSSVDANAARAVSIKSDLYQAGTMISPDSAKVVALCAVPGQIGSGEMNVANGRTEYAIDIIPNGKKTHTKVIVDAQSGAVLSSKQFGGLRGLTETAAEPLFMKTMVPSATGSQPMSAPGSLVSPEWTMKQTVPVGQLLARALGFMSTRKPAPNRADAGRTIRSSWRAVRWSLTPSQRRILSMPT